MADSAPESSAHSNKTLMSLTPGASAISKSQASLSRLQSPWFQRFVQANAGPLSVSPRRLTAEKVVLSKETQQNLALHKCDHENDAFVGSGSTIALDGFSLQLGCTEEEEKRAKGGSEKIETIKLSGCIQNETVTGVGDLKENRASEIADAKLGDEASTFPIVGSFNSHSREISDELQSSSLVVERSGEPSAQVYVLPRTEQQFCSQYRNSERVTFSGIETQNSKIETTSTIPSENSVSAFRAIPISMRKPPLPPGAVTRMKAGAPLQPNKASCHDIKLNFGKRGKALGSAIDMVIPGTKSDKEVCAKRGNSYSFYNKTNNKGAGEGLTAKFGIFDKVASAAINPMVELATFPEGIQSAYTESSLQGKSAYQQGFTAFRNDIMRKSTGRQRISEIDSKMVSNLNDRGKPFQHPTQGMTGKVHLQSFFEGQGKHTEEFTLGESLWNDDGSALQVTKASSQKGPGLFSATTTPILECQDPSRSLEISLKDRVLGNMDKSPNESSIHFKSLQADFTHCDGESNSADSSRSEKPQVNVLVQQAIFTTPCSPRNSEEMKVQASSASSRVGFLCKTLIESYYKESQCYPENQEDQMTMMRIDHMSCKMAHREGALQLPPKFGIHQAQQSFGKCVEGCECGFPSCDIDGQVGKVDTDRLQKQSNQIKIDMCNSGSKRKGTMLGADIEAILPSQYGDCSSSKTEGLLPENSIAWHPSPWASTLEYQYIDTDLHSSKRPRKTLNRDETVLDSFHSEKVVAQCSGAKGSKDPEDIQLRNRAELTEASVDAMEYKRFNPREKDSREQCHGLRHVSNQEDVSPSCLGEHPRHSDHLASSSLVKYTGLLNTPVEQNIVESMEHSPQNITLQTRVNCPGRGPSSSSQKKIDMASVLALPWIQRWCPSYQNKSSLFETHCGSAATRGINLRRFSVKRLPSAAAMAIVGIASRQLQPCKWQKLGSSRV